jgi:hypothetical protein
MRHQHLIREVPEAHGTAYQLWAEIISCEKPPETICLRFLTAWSGAKDPGAMQVKGEFFLDPAATKILIDALQKVHEQ